ncbi:MAG: PilN domain-containing protein [Terriglobia bacterium]|jgi:Tfp pilus assembly protein PilN
MIKINLLGVAPPPSRVPSVGGSPAPKATQVVMLVGALIICFGIVGVIYKVWSNQIADLEKRQSQEKIRQTELAAVKSQNGKYQQHLKDLETRINTIQALQNSRVGPVELMSALGSIISKTNDVFLFSLAPTGERVQLRGQSGTIDSMTNFMAYLKNSGSFDDVQLEQFFQDDQKDRLTYKFTLNCQFKSPTGGISPTAGGAPAGPGGPAMGSSGGPIGPRPQGAPTQAQAPRRSL